MSTPYKNGTGPFTRRSLTRFPHSSLYWIVLWFLSSMLSFYGGFFVGWHAKDSPGLPSLPAEPEFISSAKLKFAAVDRDGLEELRTTANRQLQKIQKSEQTIKDLKRQLQQERDKFQRDNNKNNKKNHNIQEPHYGTLFSGQHTSGFAVGMEFVDRTAFAEAFDTGVPLDASNSNTNDRVMIVYANGAQPDIKDGSLLTPQDATKNCNNLHVVLTQPRNSQCIAIMGQYESYHLQKFMRIDPTGVAKKGIDPDLPLTFVSRGIQQNGRISTKVPMLAQSQTHWKQLVPYLNSLDDALETLRPLAAEAASHNKHNTVIVMVCNFGQSELLLNFACNARAKGLGDVLDNILVFATDTETHDLCELFGIRSIYLQSIFEAMPSDAAKAYADKTFQQMMAAKVYCVHLVSVLGYDILFQDVDVVWFRNPLEWFHDTTNPHYHFDMYFQDDGNHALFYAPYSANTGFYYVRNNPRTQYFFGSLLMSGDLILSTSSHQIALISLLNEHASLHGLKTKIWDREKPEFPGGYTYHKRGSGAAFMKDLVAGRAKDTYIFHMSWTKNKSNKQKFLQQLGEWYLDDQCANVQRNAIDGSTKGVSAQDCCHAEPIVQCHYRDKPSKINCKDSPPIDKNGRSFW